MVYILYVELKKISYILSDSFLGYILYRISDILYTNSDI